MKSVPGKPYQEETAMKKIYGLMVALVLIMAMVVAPAANAQDKDIVDTAVAAGSLKRLRLRSRQQDWWKH